MFTLKPTYILTFTLLLAIFSCDRVKKKGHQVIDKTKEKVKNKTEQAIDEVIPTFDAYTPDTKSNKKRFKEFFGIEPTADVKNIYCFDDAIGIDADYEFAFQCHDSTIEKIVKNLDLTKTVKDSVIGLNFGPDLPWWDTTKINKIDPFWKKGEHETYSYLWFDTKTKNTYFMTFDM